MNASNLRSRAQEHIKKQGEDFRCRRRANEITLEEVAADTGLSIASIARFELGQGKVLAENYLVLMDYYMHKLLFPAE
jgi:transcriptional regulator with XRE-family HTH domain